MDHPDPLLNSDPNPDPCSREPIHIPGLIQPHGILFVLDESLVIRQTSANTTTLLDRPAESLFGTPFLELVTAEEASSVERLIREAASTFVNPFRVSITVRGKTRVFDGIAHTLHNGETVLELETDPSRDSMNSPIEGLDNYLQIVQRSLAKISGVSAVSAIADVMASEVKSFTGFDRVMVYRFAPDFHGHVIAEACDKDMDPYLGLHYPASDIPAQARELYLKNQVRLLQDVNADPVPLVPPLHPSTSAPLDMSRAVLRAMSPVHVHYLKNMEIAASLSVSIIVDDKLWGLIACHHRTPRFVSYAIRASISLYSIVLSAQLKVKQRNLENQRVAAARSVALSILTGLRDYSEPIGSLSAMLPKFMELFEAGGAALITGGHAFRYGETPAESTLSALRAELGDGIGSGVRISHRAGAEFPALRDVPETAAGIVAIHLGGMEWLILFRGEVTRQVRWAGNPGLSKDRDAHGLLTPRRSFAEWLENVSGESEPWPEQTYILTTEVRSGILEILRKRNILLSRSNQDLRRFAGMVAHEVKNHLQTGIMALSLLEERLAPGMDASVVQLAALGRERLSGLSKFTNDMLAFSETETNSKSEEIDLTEIASEIAEELKLVGKTADSSIQIHALPVIRAPRTQMRHLLSNLIRNALIHGRHPGRHLNVEIGCREENRNTVVFVRDDGRGIGENQRRKIFEYFYRGDSTCQDSTGIGLAFCAQVVERLGHRLWVEDRHDSPGSVFCFTVTPARD